MKFSFSLVEFQLGWLWVDFSWISIKLSLGWLLVEFLGKLLACLNTYRLFKKRVTKPFCILFFPALTVWFPSSYSGLIYSFDKWWETAFGALLYGITSAFSTLAKIYYHTRSFCFLVRNKFVYIPNNRENAISLHCKYTCIFIYLFIIIIIIIIYYYYYHYYLIYFSLVIYIFFSNIYVYIYIYIYILIISPLFSLSWTPLSFGAQWRLNRRFNWV